MTDTTRTSDDLWSEDSEDEDEQTKVARHPLHRSEPPAADSSRVHPRSVSSFGTPRSSWPPANGEHGSGSGRPSLYERLVQTGALDEDLAVAAERESSRPLSGELQRSGSLTLPPPPDLRELAEALEGSDSRDSSDELRDSELEMMALSSKTPTRPLRRVPLPDAPRPLPKLVGNGQVSSILLGPGASTRNDATERFSHMPSTHPLANSIAPTAPSVRPPPPAERRTPIWAVALAALLLVGAGAAIGRFRSGASVRRGDNAGRSATSAAPRAEAPARPKPALPPAPVVPPPVQPAEPDATAVAPTTPSADETRAEAKKRERDRRRAERNGEVVASAVEPTRSEAEAPSAAPVPASEPVRVRPPAPTGPLPAQPAREQVVATLDAMLPELARCVGEKHGATNVSMTVRSTGLVSYALVGGSFAGTPEGSCIARVIKLAQFPAFTDPSIRVTYPFQL